MEILYEDNHLIAVRKPAGELVQGDASGESSLMDRVKAFIKNRDKKSGNVFLGLVHRLDKPVEGIVLFAKTSKGASRISEQFRERKTKKIYQAVVEGKMTPRSGILAAKITKNEATRKAEISEEGKESFLAYKTMAEYGDLSLLEIDLGTGRFHQIRAQLGVAGHPIAGDMKYGSRRRMPYGTIALAAVKLSFKSATGEKNIEISIPIPEQWKELKRNG